MSARVDTAQAAWTNPIMNDHAVARRGRPPRQSLSDDAGTPPMREKIQQAAMRLFYEQSYQLTTVRDIGKACGITSGAIYNHFPSKDDLLYSVIKQTHDSFARDLWDVRNRWHRSPVDELHDLVVAYVHRHATNRHATLVSNLYYRFLSERHAQLIKDQRRSLRAVFEDVLQRCADARMIELPQVRGKPSTRIAAIAIGDMALRVAEWFAPNGDLGADEVAAIYAQFALDLVRARRRRPPRSG
jgi:AcrR family transcriptional regulator